MLATGWTLEYVMGMDVLTFTALETVVTRVQYTEKIEAANVAVITTAAGMSGDTDGVKKMTTSWGEAIGSITAAEQVTGLTQMMNDFPQGGI